MSIHRFTSIPAESKHGAEPPFTPLVIPHKAPGRRLRVVGLLALVCAATGPCQAATYYVAPNGSDANPGTLAAPFQHIQRAADVMLTAGDICNIRAGVYSETVTVKASNVTFQAYGSEVATISGAAPITNWVVESANVYRASAMPAGWTTLGDGNQVFQGTGTQDSLVMKPEARWPNAGSGFPWQDSSLAHPAPYNQLGNWTYVDTAGYTGMTGAWTSGWLTDAQIPSRADNYWNGATVNIMSGDGWLMACPTVTSSTNATRTLVTNSISGPNPDGTPGAYTIKPGNEYYLSGIKGEMDSAGEWFYDNATSRICFYSTTGAPANVQVKQRSYGFDIRGRTGVKLTNLDFFACTIQTDVNSTNATFDGLSMRYLGHSRKIAAPIAGIVLRNGCTLRNSELAWDSRSMVQLLGSDIRVINNHIHDSGYMPYWTAMVDAGINDPAAMAYQRNLISHNTLHDSGRSVMGFPGRASIFQYNNLYNGMKLTTDGGLFYANFDAGNSVIRYNFMHDSLGPVGHTGGFVQGFYLDSLATNWVIHHNLIWTLSAKCIQINSRMNFISVFNNSCWNGAQGSLFTSFNSDGETGTHVYNNLFNGAPVGNQATWSLTDIRYNLYTDPLFVGPGTGDFRLQATSPAINKGVPIPGITDLAPGVSVGAPDLGAIESGGTDWRSQVGYKTTAPNPDPVYNLPAMEFANKVVEGGFENGALAPNWTAAAGSNVTVQSGHAWSNPVIRTAGKSMKFGQGISEIRQTVTGLLPGRSYMLYAGTQTADTAAVVKLGVRNYNGAAAPIEGPITGNGAWIMASLPFITGPTNTTAEIYLNVTSGSATVPVYADDFGLMLETGAVNNEIYAIEAVCAPGKSLNVTGAGTANGTNVQIWQDGNAANCRWTAQVLPDGSFELMPNNAPAARLDVAGAGGSGANVQIYADNNTNAQRWKAELQSDGNYELIPQHNTALRLDVAGAVNANGTNVQVYIDNNTNAQRWKLIKK